MPDLHKFSITPEAMATATLNEALNTTGVCIEVVQFTGCDLTTPIVQHAMTAHDTPASQVGA